eukprot:CAMPEP_0180205616 /NCGR_PEP_ID=MMETSP0987-20121128/9091_1 /TAXON_ID=697907 /ORGANISM="non described non described, Strain CCMP2293" /LENGTH=110 /DNA_ID=CAMNT_0022161287 /DNA_START=59 /DNA_END=389 /DNA_ORIENTATION=-
MPSPPPPPPGSSSPSHAPRDLLNQCCEDCGQYLPGRPPREVSPGGDALQALVQETCPSTPSPPPRPLGSSRPRPALGTAPVYPLFTSLSTGELNASRKQKCFLCSPFYGT